MELSTNITHTITFSIQAFWNEEGGMGQDTFGEDCGSLNEAVVLLDLAQIKEPKLDWIITCNTFKKIKPGQLK